MYNNSKKCPFLTHCMSTVYSGKFLCNWKHFCRQLCSTDVQQCSEWTRTCVFQNTSDSSIYDANESKKCRREVWQHHDRLLLNNNDWDGSRLSQQCQYVVGCWWLQTSQWHHPTTLKNNSAWITLQVPCTKSPSVSCIISYTFHLVD